MSTPILAAAGRGLSFVYLFIRFAVLNFSLMLPLLGAATVSSRLSATVMLGLVAIALAFHCFAYVLNDVIDLPVDSSEPLRQEYPLVQGIIDRRPALAFALLQVPLALALTARLGTSIEAHTTLLVGFGLMAVYNLWGKRCPFPPLTDAIQGLAWGMLALYGAFDVGSPTALTCALLGLVLVLVLMINGVHGALRDLTNDLRNGARTTAIWLGGRPCDGGLCIPQRLLRYALSLQALFLALGLLACARADYAPRILIPSAGAVVLVNASCLALLLRALQASADKCNMIRYGIWHLALSLGGLIVPFGARLQPVGLAVLLSIYVLPLVTMWLRYGFKWG